MNHKRLTYASVKLPAELPTYPFPITGGTSVQVQNHWLDEPKTVDG